MTEGRNTAASSSATEQARYNAAWATGKYKPMIGLAYVQCLYRTYYFEGYKTLLDVGCGTGAAVKYHRVVGGINAIGMDFAAEAVPTWKKMGVDHFCVVASAEDIPFADGTFDMVTCTDMLEHIPEKSVRQVLGEMYRVGRRDFWFTVALKPATHKMPHDGSEPHVCLKPPEWWLEEMVRIGYRFHSMPFANHTLVVEARKREAEPRRYKPLQ